MARAETITKLPLDRWAALIGIHPMHFNGVYDPNRPTTPCEQPWMQHPWQAADRIGREEVAQAIAEAEADIERHLRFRLLPAWERDEWQRTERPWRPELFNLTATDVRGFAQTVAADWGYLVTGGVRQKDELTLQAAIGYSNPDGDTYDELATVTGGVTVELNTPACEVHVYFPGYAGADEWEIRPINVTVVGTTATITFRREQCVLPEFYDDLVPDADDSHMRGVDGSVDANFLTNVDVYRVYNDPQTQVTFLWEPLGIGCSSCDGSGCGHCAYTAQTGCLMLRSEPRLSVVSYRPGSWDAANDEFTMEAYTLNRTPDIARLYYYAGWRDKSLACPTVRMDPHWERVVAYYAASKLDRPICECNNVGEWVDHWQRDLAIAGADEFLKVPDRMLDNPFGTRRGAIYAWQRVKKDAIGKGVMP